MIMARRDRLIQVHLVIEYEVLNYAELPRVHSDSDVLILNSVT